LKSFSPDLKVFEVPEKLGELYKIQQHGPSTYWSMTFYLKEMRMGTEKRKEWDRVRKWLGETERVRKWRSNRERVRKWMSNRERVRKWMSISHRVRKKYKCVRELLRWERKCTRSNNMGLRPIDQWNFVWKIEKGNGQEKRMRLSEKVNGWNRNIR
jgi:hypothetical protein